MGQMQKMFKWDRDQQEWAQKVLRDTGKKWVPKKKFTRKMDPFKNCGGWTTHFKGNGSTD